MTANPPLGTWTTPFGPTPFDRIRPEHFPPAFGQGMAGHLRESVWISPDLGRHTERLAELAELGFDEMRRR